MSSWIKHTGPIELKVLPRICPPPPSPPLLLSPETGSSMTQIQSTTRHEFFTATSLAVNEINTKPSNCCAVWSVCLIKVSDKKQNKNKTEQRKQRRNENILSSPPYARDLPSSTLDHQHSHLAAHKTSLCAGFSLSRRIFLVSLSAFPIPAINIFCINPPYYCT